MNWIVLENEAGVRRKLVPGQQIRPPRTPDERIVGIEREGSALVLGYEYRYCSSCGEKGVYERT